MSLPISWTSQSTYLRKSKALLDYTGLNITLFTVQQRWRLRCLGDFLWSLSESIVSLMSVDIASSDLYLLPHVKIVSNRTLKPFMLILDKYKRVKSHPLQTFLKRVSNDINAVTCGHLLSPAVTWSHLLS